MPSADFCAAITTLANRSVPLRDTSQTSRGKTSRLRRTPAEFTTPTLDDYGLRDHLLARPVGQASYPVLVHRVAALLHASFRPCLATSPLRFAYPSPPSGWIGDSHPQAAGHARHTKKKSSQGELSHLSLLNDGQHQIRPLIRPRFCSASKETTTKRHENTLENRPVPERRYKHALNTDIITSY